ncbi:hypothetical protein PCANC_17861 [Puccinia coronata f. sp. avenae]|uniref:Uncharacterized protein n=1 Tax=Puccinia coronata f. sp. avenae TaxID=200324 RepID=A0A2N5U6R4_9BASI|nr:hypothetical protein PCANC_17861 [Puccinia coronata f. sp. avenae]
MRLTLDEALQLKEAREKKIRDDWIRVMEMRINQEKLERTEGVNSYEQCAHLAQSLNKLLCDGAHAQTSLASTHHHRAPLPSTSLTSPLISAKSLSLELLDCRLTENITSNLINALALSVPNIRHLDVRGCPYVHVTSVARLAETIRDSSDSERRIEYIGVDEPLEPNFGLESAQEDSVRWEIWQLWQAWNWLEFTHDLLHQASSQGPRIRLTCRSQQENLWPGHSHEEEEDDEDEDEEEEEEEDEEDDVDEDENDGQPEEHELEEEEEEEDGRDKEGDEEEEVEAEVEEEEEEGESQQMQQQPRVERGPAQRPHPRPRTTPLPSSRPRPPPARHLPSPPASTEALPHSHPTHSTSHSTSTLASHPNSHSTSHPHPHSNSNHHSNTPHPAPSSSPFATGPSYPRLPGGPGGG